MNARIQTLKAEIAADQKVIAEIFGELAAYGDRLTDHERIIVVAYYLHNLYCAFESIFQRIAEVFENHVSDQADGTPNCCTG